MTMMPKEKDKWKRAEENLNKSISACEECAKVVGFTPGLNVRRDQVLLPLRRRYKGGERTDELYESMMNCR